MTDFATEIETHRRELRVHCYRMLGSFDEAEDLVREMLLRWGPRRLRSTATFAELLRENVRCSHASGGGHSGPEPALLS
jgi:pentatricopeptide repeat protein